MGQEKQDKSVSLLEKVSSLKAVVDTQIPGNGERWKITEFQHFVNPNQDTHTRLVWDYQGANEEILAIGYGSGILQIDRDIVGDGTKKLALIVQNDSLSAEYLGGAYTAYNNG